jgi:hypothetical protein
MLTLCPTIYILFITVLSRKKAKTKKYEQGNSQSSAVSRESPSESSSVTGGIKSDLAQGAVQAPPTHSDR